MEGLQIALVELKREPAESYRESHPAAYRLGQLAGQADNIEKFLMGRQVFVVCLVFFAAKAATKIDRKKRLLCAKINCSNFLNISQRCWQPILKPTPVDHNSWPD